MNRIQYVVGLAFNHNMNRVVMILKKTGPECIIGKWNGVGGKVEVGEDIVAAMVREFKEETGVQTDRELWLPLAVLEAQEYDLWFYWIQLEDVHSAATVEAEEVKVWWVNEILAQINIPNNIRWMIPFLCDDEIHDHDIGLMRVGR